MKVKQPYATLTNFTKKVTKYLDSFYLQNGKWHKVQPLKVGKVKKSRVRHHEND